MARKKSKQISRPPSQRAAEIDAMNTVDMPMVRIGLRPDGALCLILPGVGGQDRTPIVLDTGLANTLRRILSSARDNATVHLGVASENEPCADQLRHAVHLEDNIYDSRCAHCQYAMVLNGLEPGAVKIKRVETRKVATTGDVTVQRRVSLHYCACGFGGSFREFAEHMALHNPLFPRAAPKGFPHGEVSVRWARAREKTVVDRAEQTRKIASGEIEELDL